MKRSVLIAWLFMLVGALIYLIGLWRACPLLSGKGYFLGVLITSMFIIYVYQREVKRGLLDVRFAAVCQMVALMTSGLLLWDYGMRRSRWPKEAHILRHSVSVYQVSIF